jgi:DNA-directed RNA polymerase specialized sigma24 family protein
VTADTDGDRFARIDASRAEVAHELFDRVLVSEALNQLHPSHREVIRKAYYLRWTTGQIAADLNVAEPVVKSRLHYALHTLRLTLIDLTAFANNVRPQHL